MTNLKSWMCAAFLLMLGACSSQVVEDFAEENPGGVRAAAEDPADLSAKEMANCYIVTSPGTYRFKADNMFNLGDGLPVPPELQTADASLVWQTAPGLISGVNLIEEDGVPYIEFTVTKAEGNALIASLDADGAIEWSWHIWMPAEPVASVKAASGYEVMNMNLGAINNSPGDPASYGLLYQWGRKEPLPAAPTLTGTTTTVGAPLYDIEGNAVTIKNSSWTDSDCNTLQYALSHPTVCLSNYARYTTSRDWLVEGNDALWGNPAGYDPEGEVKFASSGQKTCYDPSPAGWRVAPPDAFSNFTTTGGYVWDFADFNVADVNDDGQVSLDDYNYGWHFLMDAGKSLFFPAAARYDGSYAMLMGSMSGLWGNYWSNSPYPGISGGAFCALSFQTRGQNGEDWVTVSPSGGASRADAFSIRCVRDTETTGGDTNGIKHVVAD